MPHDSGIQVRLVAAGDPRVREAERSLDAQGFAIPLQSRALWGELLGGPAYRHALAEDGKGQYLAMLGFSITPTRALPGHQILRLETVGDAYASPVGRVLIAHAAEYAIQSSRILRVIVELECRSEQLRDSVRKSLSQLGFVPGPTERVAPRTIELELSADEDSLFSALSRSTRQNVRAAAKHGIQIQQIQDPALEQRMNQLLTASFARTGGRTTQVDWPAIMRLGVELPQRSNLVGAFRQAEGAGQELVAFAWSMHHGDRAEYSHGASARIPGVTIRLLTPVLWDLITWAKREGARWFDFGGITAGSADGADALGGISDFKRGFSKREIGFGEEWVFEPSPAKARVARLASSAMELVRRRR